MMKEQMAAFFVSGSIVVLLAIILVEIFSDMCCLEDNASWNCQTSTLARSISPRSALRSLDVRRGLAKTVRNFFLLCLVQVSCNSVQQEII